MITDFPIFPVAASSLASSVDRLYLFALLVSAFFSLLIAVLILVLGIRYRRRAPDQVGAPPAHGGATTLLEVTWSAVPLLILVVLFVWGVRIFFEMARPPADAMELWVVGKQWMWKIQHPDGTREINEVHLPLGRAAKFTMTSEDVIHSFFVPAFRTKADVLPGRYTTVWFRPDRIGTFHLFCAEYCGAEHSRMIGRIVVLEPRDYERWLAGARPGRTPIESGAELFAARACDTCHRPDTAARAPLLAGLLGRRVELEGGRAAVADAAYFRESILSPQAKIVAGYQPIMPTYRGQLTEEEIIQLVEYVKSLSPGTTGAQP